MKELSMAKISNVGFIEVKDDKYVGLTLSVCHNGYQSSTVTFKSPAELEVAHITIGVALEKLRKEKA